MNLIMIKTNLKSFCKIILLYLLKFADSLLWLIIRFLPNKILWKSIKSRPFKNSNFSFTSKSRNKCKVFIKRSLKLINLNHFPLSSCLSRSILGMFLLDLLSVENILRIGIIKDASGEKITHAWLIDPINENSFTPSGYINSKSIYLVEI